MSVQNLAIVFGPTLFGQVAPNMNGQLNGMADAGLQNKVSEILIGRSCVNLKECLFPHPRVSRVRLVQAIETILEHYTDIFVDENEDA